MSMVKNDLEMQLVSDYKDLDWIISTRIEWKRIHWETGGCERIVQIKVISRNEKEILFEAKDKRKVIIKIEKENKNVQKKS